MLSFNVAACFRTIPICLSALHIVTLFQKKNQNVVVALSFSSVERYWPSLLLVMNLVCVMIKEQMGSTVLFGNYHLVLGLLIV